MYDKGEWVIDTYKKDAVTIENVIEGCYSGNIYMVSTDDGDCYMVKESRLIKYDKYYFDLISEGK